MQGSEFAELKNFVAVARRGSFTRAAADMGISPSTLSQTIRNLEARVGLALLNRTTRSARPTDAGEKLLEKLESAFEEIEMTVDQLNVFRVTPSGVLRLCVTGMAKRLVILPLQSEFASLYPDIILDICVDDRMDDIIAGRFDAGIRLAGHSPQDMIAVHVTPPSRFVVVGSPSYFAARGRPSTRDDLLQHNCLRYRLACSGRTLDWVFERDGERMIVPVKGNLITGDLEVMRNAVLEGVGIAGMYERDVADLIEQGALETALEDWSANLPGLDIFFPYQRQTHTPLRKFVDFLKEHYQASGNAPIRPLAIALAAE